MKQYKLTHRLLAGVSFLITLITYVSTLQPSVPWWDCGEFTAATTWQQVPHPPGAPFWLIVARVFQMLIPSGDLGWRVNLFSAVCSAVTAALVYLIVVKLIERWHPYRSDRPLSSYIGTFAGGLIGTLAFTWSDSQWFNSVESEVYAGGATLIALLMYLMMRWDEESQNKGHERYILLMAYVVGVAFGVHLLALLVVPGIAMVIYFRNYEFKLSSFAWMIGITAVAFYLFVYKGPLEYIPKMLAGQNLKIMGIMIKSDVARVLGILTMLGLAGLLWWSVKEHKPKVFLSVASFLLILLGFTSYVQILIRANAHPVMNENEPDTITELVSYLGRDQYGKSPNWPRRYRADQYYRQYQDKYGEWYEPTGYTDEGLPIFDRINGGGELNFMFDYQIGQMYIRYLFWNFVGRISDEQNASWTVWGATEQQRQKFIAPSGRDDIFPIQFLALPLLIGLFGLYYHYKRDWKMALVFTALFLLLGVLATLQQNQQEPQPRERDYFYIGSFMVFAMWIGIGATGLADTIRELKGTADTEGDESTGLGRNEGFGMTAAVLGVCFIAAPLNMAVGGWKMHSRAGNWAPWDYSYNVLQSCEKDAILFTNGDNDTFPVWYLQDVAGVRRDVRVVNLELGQTLWYMKQLKNERPWGAKKVPLTYPDSWFEDPEGTHIELSPSVVSSAPFTIDVPAAAMARYTTDSVPRPGTMSWVLYGKDYGQGQKYVGFKQKLVAEILKNVKWERPVYFSATTYTDAWGGLEEYLRREGMAYRVVPVKQKPSQSYGFPIDEEITRKCAIQTLKPDEYYTEPHYGFKLRNHNNPDVFFREDDRQWVSGYWELYVAMTMDALQANNSKEALETLGKMNELISPDLFAMPYWISSVVAQLYEQAGDKAKAKEFAQRAIKRIDEMGDSWQDNPYARSYNPMDIKKQMEDLMKR